MISFRFSFALLMTVSALAAHAMPGQPIADDRDLNPARGPLRPFLSAPVKMAPDRQVTTDDASLTVQVLREDHGKLTPVVGLPFVIGTPAAFQVFRTDARGLVRMAACTTPATQPVPVSAPLKDQYIDVTNGRSTYTITASVPCRGITQLIYKQDSDGGQAVGIWQVARRAEEKLTAEIGTTFWKRPITFVWPSGGDYYDGSTVNLTRGDYWDVVGHEMGHAIYDLGQLGVFGGGEHKIDECYSDAMAISEGWASMFSAWVSVDLRDPDAKFEYMVPRRSPIRFENIPADVCKGPRNEWRVTGYFWDLVDLNADGENSQLSFKFTWDALLGKRARNMTDVKNLLLQKGIPPQTQDAVWSLNFL